MTNLIFIHSGFRTGSSWLRSKFRANPNALVFGEIFHESLATIDRQTAVSFSNRGWNSRHPETAPYFLEFAPLIRPTGGVEGYSEDMAFDLYFPTGGELSDHEKQYIGQIIDHSLKMDKIVIMSCTRSLGRMNEIKREFGGTHILLTRNPFAQWSSYTEQAANGNRYFISTNERIINAARTADWFQFGDAVSDFLSQDAFYKHLLLHLKLYNEAAPRSDIILCYDYLDREDYRADIGNQISAKCGMAVDLSDFCRSSQFSLIDTPPSELIDQVLLPFLPPLQGGMHPHVADLYVAMRASMESYAELSGELVKFGRKKISELQDSDDQLKKALSELEAAESAANAVRSELEAAEQRCLEAREQCSDLAAQVRTAEAAYEASNTQAADLVTRLEAERAANAISDARTIEALQSNEAVRAQVAGLHERLGAAEVAHREAIEKLWHERRSAEEQLRRATEELDKDLRRELRETQAAEAAARVDVARLEERSSQLTERLAATERDAAVLRKELDRTGSMLGKADDLICRAASIDRSGWRKLAEAFGLVGESLETRLLKSWPRSAEAVALYPQTDLTQSVAKPEMHEATPTGRRNPYLRAHSLTELLSWDDVDFVRCAYVTVLGRQPDREGEVYYTERLRSGVAKMHLLRQIRTSPEARRHDPGIAGFDKALRRHRNANRPLIGPLLRWLGGFESDLGRERRARALDSRLGRLQAAVESMQQHCASVMGLAEVQDRVEWIAEHLFRHEIRTISPDSPDLRPVDAAPTPSQFPLDQHFTPRASAMLKELRCRARVQG
jgi:uncharacterized protein DUF4214